MADRDAATQPTTAWGPLLAVAAAVGVALLATSGGYGYHRDELYFLEAGQHLAWGYPDQPPLTPLLARLMSALAPDSLVVLRLPSAVASAVTVVVTGLIARDLGAGRAAQTLAAASVAVSSLFLALGHLLSTATFDLLVWTVLTWLIVRILRGGDQRLWLVVGVVGGIGLLNKLLVVFLVAGVVAGLLIAGPRSVFRSPWLWAGAALATVVWAPNLLWQATHGWPQLELSRAIASGSSGTSEPVALFVPFQFVLISPVLVPVWVAGLVRLFRDPGLATVRAFGWAYLVLAVVFMATGGKPYYLGGLYPALLAAGAPAVVAWIGHRRARTVAVVAALALAAVVSATLMLPLVPATALHATPIVDINYDAGEQIGWPALVASVAEVYSTLPAGKRSDAVIVTRNYGQAGAIDRYGGAHGLPGAYSGHNAYAEWGPPPDSAATAVVVGFDEVTLGRHCSDVSLAATFDNGIDLDNDEQGTPIWICRDLRRPWSQLWPELRRLG